MILIKIIIAVCLTVAAGTTIEAIIPDEPKAEIIEVQETPVVEEVKEEENLVTKDIILRISIPKKVNDMIFEFQTFNGDCTFFELIDYPDLYVSRGGIKVTVSGDESLLNTLPENVSIEDSLNFPIQAFVDVQDYTLGEHITNLNITSSNPAIQIISTSSIKVKYEVIEKYSGNFCYTK